jgi:predicted phage-related endonuclease
VGAIFGLDRYRTPEDVWLEKTGQVIPIDEPSGDKERGVRLEPIAAELYAERSGLRVTRISQPLTHPDFPWMRGNIDRLGMSANIDEENVIIEIKCPSLGMYSKIKREGLPYSRCRGRRSSSSVR